MIGSRPTEKSKNEKPQPKQQKPREVVKGLPMQLTIVLPITINCDSDDKAVQDGIACEVAAHDENAMAIIDLMVKLANDIRRFRPEIEAHFTPCAGVYEPRKI